MKVDPEVIARYLEGREIEGDQEQISAWFSNLEAEKDLRNNYKAYWDALMIKLETEEYDSTSILGRIYHRIKLDESNSLPSNRPATRLLNILSKAAAVLFIPVLAILFFNRENLTRTTGEMSYSEIHSPPGTRTMFYMPDGSTGWLNGDSHLKFPTEFRGKTREVELHGEAYFNVAPEAKRHFIVTGRHFKVTAHGTVFNVQAYERENLVAVTLLEGLVEVHGIHETKEESLGMLKPDQMFVYDPMKPAGMISTVNAPDIVAWKDGKLVFRDEPFKDVILRLNRWYNVDIILKDKILESHPYRATFEDETLEEVLKLLKLSAPITYKDLGRERKADGSFEKRKIEIYYQQ